MKHDKIDLFCNRSYRTGLIKKLKSRRYVKIRAVRFTRQKRRSVDIVAGSAFCFEEKTRKLLETADRASGRTAYFDGNTSQSRHMATAVHAAGSARLFGLSHSLAYAQGGAGVFYCRVQLAALGSSSGSCVRSSVDAFSPARQLKCSELVLSILAECRVFGNSSKITLRFRRNPSASRSRAFTLKTVRRQNLACVQMALISKPAFDLPVFTSKTIDKR